MGLREARKYIVELRKRQSDPFLWPDFLTGLPGVGAILKKIRLVYPKLSIYSIAYIRIANVHPYLIKYGSAHHQEVIQWAAAILRSASEHQRGFVGAMGTHDFVAVCKTRQMGEFMDEAGRMFEKKALGYYSPEDRRSGCLFSFKRDGVQVDVGLMKLIHARLEGEVELPQEAIIPHLAGRCTEVEREGI